jgi:hypothetical protein
MYSPTIMLEFGIRFHFYGFFSGVELSFFNYVLAIGFKQEFQGLTGLQSKKNDRKN